MSKSSLFLRVIFSGLLVAQLPISGADKPGYTDTPMIPGQKWRVHDAERPHPEVITPGKTFSDMAPPPSDAIVLFDGTNLDKWTGRGGSAQWKVEDGHMEVNNTGGIRTRDEFGDFQLHIEFATPTKVEGSSQGRGNSGVFLHGQFEVQVLDSYNNPTYADGQLGALYGQYPPLANPARPPGEWQTYDIAFEAPRWNDQGELIKKAKVTVILNGVVMHSGQELLGPSTHRAVGQYRKYSSRGPIELQDHSNPTRFRNIWIRPLGERDDTGE